MEEPEDVTRAIGWLELFFDLVVVVSMALIALMAASIIRIDDRANVFAIAFIVSRVSTSRASLQTGRLLTSWPLLELGGTTAVWIASLCVHTPAKFVMWARSAG